MSVTALIALAILVMLAGGFYAGRARAIQAVEGNTVRLHSLPNYHGYYVAIWTGLPALLLLLAHGMFADKVVENLTYAELRREASSLNVQLNDALSLIHI